MYVSNIYMHVCAYVCTYVCMYIGMYVCTYVCVWYAFAHMHEYSKGFGMTYQAVARVEDEMPQNTCHSQKTKLRNNNTPLKWRKVICPRSW